MHRFKLEVDVSALGAGAVLLQEGPDGVDHPVCYFSKKFKNHQLHYSTIEKEALALLLALHFISCPVGRKKFILLGEEVLQG